MAEEGLREFHAKSVKLTPANTGVIYLVVGLTIRLKRVLVAGLFVPG